MKNLFYLTLFMLLPILFSCSSKQPKQVENEGNIFTKKTLSVDDSIAAVEVLESTVVTDTPPTSLPQKTIKKETPKIAPRTNKNKVDKEAPALPQKRNSALAKENTPQKIIGNEYFEVVEGYYCNDNWSGNPYYVACTNCAFHREFFLKNKSKEHLFIKDVWCGNTKKEVNMWVEAEGRGEHIRFGVPAFINAPGLPPPIPYQGQALISYSVGDANGKIRYFDVTNLIKWCGNFYTHKHPDPKGGGPYK